MVTENSTERLLNIHEASHYLDRSEKDIQRLVKTGDLEAYHIGGMYLRFKADNIKKFKNKAAPYALSENSSFVKERAGEKDESLIESVADFLYFNDFYIFSIIAVAALIFIILKNI